MKETPDWRAVCGKTARTVRREGRRKAFPTPITVEATACVDRHRRPVVVAAGGKRRRPLLVLRGASRSWSRGWSRASRAIRDPAAATFPPPATEAPPAEGNGE